MKVCPKCGSVGKIIYSKKKMKQLKLIGPSERVWEKCPPECSGCGEIFAKGHKFEDGF